MGLGVLLLAICLLVVSAAALVFMGFLVDSTSIEFNVDVDPLIIIATVLFVGGAFTFSNLRRQ